MGVSASGAADPVALRIGNRLVGNAEGAAGLEMTLLGGTFVFPERAVVALTGVDFGATLDNGSLWTCGVPLEVQPGQTLRMGPTRAGARCYLCVQGRHRCEIVFGERVDASLERAWWFRGPIIAEGRRAKD